MRRSFVFALCLVAFAFVAVPTHAAEAEVPSVVSPATCAGDLVPEIAEEGGMTPAVEPTPPEIAGIPEPVEVDFCDWDYRWVYHSCGCVKVWGIAVKEKEQRRWCCIQAGCGGWSNTGATRCTGIPCD